MEFVPFEQRDNVDDLSIIACYFCSDPKKWEFLTKCKFSHITYGRGNVTQIECSGKKEIIISIQFADSVDHDIKLFQDLAFRNGFFTFDKKPLLTPEMEEYINYVRTHIRVNKERLHKEVEEKIRLEKERLERIDQELRQKEQEKLVREKFKTLSEKYYVRNLVNFDPTNRLFMILVKLEDEEVLTVEEIEYLKRSNYFGPLAKYYEFEYQRDQSKVWRLVTACSAWRDAKLPLKTLEISNKVNFGEQKAMSALLTTRGGAFRDLVDFEEAKISAKKAIQLQPEGYHAFNLLGAILYQEGNYPDADSYFEKAIKNGSSEKAVDEEIKRSVNRSSMEEQRIVAEYLLKKDPKRYEWAGYYLKNYVK